MIQFADYIKTKEEIVVSDSGYSQLEIENLLQQIEINAQDAFLSDETSKREKRNAVETIRWIRSVRPNLQCRTQLRLSSPTESQQRSE